MEPGSYEFGVVKSFDRDTLYGFIVPDDRRSSEGRDVYFQLKNVGTPMIQEGTVVLVKKDATICLPYSGQRVVYKKVLGEKGYRAELWADIDLWSELSKRFKEKEYRVVSFLRFGKKICKWKVLWSGRLLTDDLLLRIWEPEGEKDNIEVAGVVIVRYFQVKTEKGWKKLKDDPRIPKAPK